jgi:hypothetical protein
MHEVTLIWGLLVAVAAIVGVARRVAMPYPGFLVLGDLILALIPGVPAIQLRPDLVFLRRGDTARKTRGRRVCL